MSIKKSLVCEYFSWKRNTFDPSVNVGSMFSIWQSEEMRFLYFLGVCAKWSCWILFFVVRILIYQMVCSLILDLYVSIVVMDGLLA